MRKIFIEQNAYVLLNQNIVHTFSKTKFYTFLDSLYMCKCA